MLLAEIVMGVGGWVGGEAAAPGHPPLSKVVMDTETRGAREGGEKSRVFRNCRFHHFFVSSPSPIIQFLDTEFLVQGL